MIDKTTASTSEDSSRTIGLLGATSVGVGAIVGGGILVLAGVAFESTGPGAVLAFAGNGLVAFLTALSFAEMSTAFPESGGAYQFSKKTLSMKAAFVTGWILWFAYIVGATLYALGFGAFASAAIWRLTGGEGGATAIPMWWVLALGGSATAVYLMLLSRRSTGSGPWAVWGKVVVFLALVGAGAWAVMGQEAEQTRDALTPMLPEGTVGLLKAMGYTFIALQGFELVSTIAGEVKQPLKTIPRAMFLSLGIALAVYLPLLLVVAGAGAPEGQDIKSLAECEPDTVIASAVQNFMGPTGYWFVMVAAVLATLTALEAYLLAASRVAQTMAADRSLPKRLAVLHPEHKTPAAGVLVSGLIVFVLIICLPSAGAAGAAASLIFLVSFALAHGTSILVRRRVGNSVKGFRTPWFPLFPLIGGLACLTLAVFQGISVPSAGVITLVWLVIGVALYMRLFARGAESRDAFSLARNPELMRLRGREIMVLAPIANPNSARGLLGVAHALAPTGSGRVVLLNVLRPPEAPPDQAPSELPRSLVSAQAMLGESLSLALAEGWAPQTLMTIAPDPWTEIRRVARLHACHVLLLGMSEEAGKAGTAALDSLINRVACDVVVLYAPPDWRIDEATRILVPVAGHGGYDRIRSHFLGSLCRTRKREVSFLRILPESASDAEHDETLSELTGTATDAVPDGGLAEVVKSNDITGTLAAQTRDRDLMILGLSRQGRSEKVIGNIAVEVAAEAHCPIVLISTAG